MRTASKKALAVAAALVALGAGTAVATAGVSPQSRVGIPSMMRGSMGPQMMLRRLAVREIVRASAGYLDLTPAALAAEVRSGSSLADVTAAQGKSVDGLKAAIVASVTSRLDVAVARGRITQALERRLLARLESRLDAIVDRTAPAA